MEVRLEENGKFTGLSQNVNALESNLNVSVQDKSNQITTTNEMGRLSQSENDRMVQEAEKDREEHEGNKSKPRMVRRTAASLCVTPSLKGNSRRASSLHLVLLPRCTP